uniref:Retrotransposon gag domain-containing protein n=1 Tax=Ananas comosus var. bracteatus TaxID=296719 RepID=A0A6V7Q2H3_ANACO|nr:unnamed protein product [Ananas comosus var. bracteatus]
MEEAARYEKWRQEDAKRHQQLIEMLTALMPSSQSVNTPLVIREGRQVVQDNSTSSNFVIQQNDMESKILAPIERERLTPTSIRPARNQPPQQYIPYLKLQIPTFNGTDPKGWLRNCEQYFDRYQIPEQQWIGVASWHIGDDARFWKQAYFFNRPRVNWSEFSDAICKRFTAAKEGYPIRKFSTCEQTNSIESCRQNCEAAKRPEIMVQEDDHIHEAGSAGSEQECDDYLQLEINRRPEIALSERASKREELLKLLATQPPLLGPAHNAPNAYATSAVVGSTTKTVENTAHSSKENSDYNLIEGAAASKQTKMQGLCDGYGEEYIIGKQYENSSLHMLPAQKKGALGAESETAKEGCEPQRVEEGNAYDTVSIKESNNQALLILQRFLPQFARKKPGYKFLADSRELRLKSSDIALRIDWMKEYRQVPFDPGPNKVTFRSIEGEASHKFIMTSKLQKVIHQKIQGMLGQSAMIRIGGMAKAITTEGCKRVNSIGLFGTVEGLNKHIQRRPIEAYQESIENSRIQTLLRNSSLEEAYIAYSLVNGCKELGSELKMPHPCSRFLAYEQDKLQESDVSDCNSYNINYGHRMMVKGHSLLSLIKGYVRHKYGEIQDVRELEDEASCFLIIPRMAIRKLAYKKWCNGLSRRTTSKDCSALKKRANGEQNEISREDHTEIKTMEKIPELTFSQYALYYISVQTRLSARRLRLPEGPEGEPPPQQEPPSMRPTRDDRRVWPRIRNSSNRPRWRNKTEQTFQYGLKEVTLKKKKVLLGKQMGAPTQLNKFHP